jgi:hypothetical protein
MSAYSANHSTTVKYSRVNPERLPIPFILKYLFSASFLGKMTNKSIFLVTHKEMKSTITLDFLLIFFSTVEHALFDALRT